MQIRIANPADPQLEALLHEHLASLASISPAESMHALDIAGLQRPNVTFWAAYRGDDTVGCGALLELEPTHGEIKSMRTAAEHIRTGIASALLQHIIKEAQRRAYKRISLETGSQAVFAPAHALYERFGFVRCGPFANYSDDPNSLFMTRQL